MKAAYFYQKKIVTLSVKIQSEANSLKKLFSENDNSFNKILKNKGKVK